MTLKKYQNPKGGLNKRGQQYYKVRPGVKHPQTLEDYRRRYSWSARFYNRKKLPPLQDKKGRPTRFALSSNAWGFKVPKTKKEARNIYKKAKSDYKKKKKSQKRKK